MTTRARGPFDVTLAPLPAYDSTDGSTLGRMSIDKQFRGELEATGKGEMLMAGTSTKGSAGYVAIERVRGHLHGKLGSFVLQHSGTMDHGVPSLTVTVVPDSGTEQLVGLSGSMAINIDGKQHEYVFDYSIV